MLGDLMVATFLILLAASIAAACLMVMFHLIDLAFKKKAKPAPRLLRPDARLVDVNYSLKMRNVSARAYWEEASCLSWPLFCVR